MILGRLIRMWYEYRNDELILICVIRTTKGEKVRKEVPAPFRPYFFTTKPFLNEVKKVVTKYCSNPNYTRAVNCVAVDDREAELRKVEVNNPRNVGNIRRDLHLRCRFENCRKKCKDFPELMNHAKHDHGLTWEEYESQYLIKIYEADIPYARRVMIDLGIKSGIKITDNDKILPATVNVPPKLLFWDLETDDRDKKMNPEKSRILSISGNDKFFCDDDEAKMLEDFQDYAKEYDYLIGHNSEKFDLPYFQKRCRVNNVECILWQYCEFLDQKVVWKKSHDRDVPSSMEYLAKTILDRERVQVKSFWEAFTSNRELLKKRNLDCCDITKEINEKIHLVEGRIELAEFVGLRASKAIYSSVVAETAVMREAFERVPREVFLCRIRERIGKKYKGALILEPVKGRHRFTLLFDFKRLYPRVVRTFNLGLDTLDPNGEIETPYARFTLKKESLCSSVIRKVEQNRDYYERLRDKTDFGSSEYLKYDLLQKSRKIVLECVYGIHGDPSSRFYNKPVAESITYFARFFLQKSVDKINRLEIDGIKCRVLYGDTDSNFVEAKPTPTFEILLTFAKRLEIILNTYFCSILESMGIPKERWVIETRLEKIYDSLLFGDVKKKRHGHIIWKEGRPADEIETKGFELVRGDWSPLAREFQEVILNMLVVKGNSPEAVLDYAEYIKDSLLSGGVPIEELILSKNVRKALADYKANQPHIRAAKKVVARGYNEPSRVEYVVVAYRGKMKVEPILGDDKPLITQSGLEYYWSNQLAPLLTRILDYIGYSKPVAILQKKKTKRGRKVSSTQRGLGDYKDFKPLVEHFDKIHKKMEDLYGEG